MRQTYVLRTVRPSTNWPAILYGSVRRTIGSEARTIGSAARTALSAERTKLAVNTHLRTGFGTVPSRKRTQRAIQRDVFVRRCSPRRVARHRIATHASE